MKAESVTAGIEVVRSKGDYVVGRVGIVVDVDNEKQRAQVSWHKENKTWVSFASIEPTSIPYKILNQGYGKPKYVLGK